MCCGCRQDPENSFYTMYVKGSDTATCDMKDSYTHEVSNGQDYIWGHYLEKETHERKGVLYFVDTSKYVYFFRENIVYPFVNMEEKRSRNGKEMLYLDNGDFCEVVAYVEATKMAMLHKGLNKQTM